MQKNFILRSMVSKYKVFSSTEHFLIFFLSKNVHRINVTNNHGDCNIDNDICY